MCLFNPNAKYRIYEGFFRVRKWGKYVAFLTISVIFCYSKQTWPITQWLVQNYMVYVYDDSNVLIKMLLSILYNSENV